MSPDRTSVGAFEAEFNSVRANAEKAIVQLDDDQIRKRLDDRSNSVAVIMKHLGGNLRSRFTNFLSEDGEKPWRDRDEEFIDSFAPGGAGRREIVDHWDRGWSCVIAEIGMLTDADLGKTVTIRGEPHSVARALARSVAHVSYHTGQIVMIARTIVGPGSWRTITIARGGSAEYNRKLGYRAEA
jgi:predicted secreted protein